MFDQFYGDIDGQNIYDDPSIDLDDLAYDELQQKPKHYKMNKEEKQEPAPRILTGEIKRETEKAILFKFGESENWMPKSQVKVNKKKEGCSIEIPAWLWDKMNQIEE